MYSHIVRYTQKTLKIDAHYFLRGGFWLAVAQFFTVSSGLISTILFAHYLSPDTYGTYKYLIGLSSIFATFSLTGLGQSILQTAAKNYLAFYSETFKLNAIYNLGITITSIIGSLYYFINHNSLLAIGCLLIAVIQPIINQFQLVPALLQGSKKFRESTFQQIFRTLFVITFPLIALFHTSNVLVLFTTYLISQAISNFISERYHRPKKFEPTPLEVFQKYVSFARHTSIRNIIVSIALKLDTIIIFTQLGAAELATYTIATIIPEQIRGSIKGLSTLLLPKYAQQDNLDILKKGIAKRTVQLFLVLTLVVLAYTYASPFIFDHLFPKYKNALLYSQIFSLVLISNIYYLPYSVLSSRISERELYIQNITGSILQIILIILLINPYGILGVIWARIIARHINTAITYHLLYKKK